MQPEVEKGDIVNVAPYHFYMKTTGDVSEDAFSRMTVPLDTEKSSKVRDTVIAYRRKRYATPKVEVEGYMEELFEQKNTNVELDKPIAELANPTKSKKSQSGASKSPKGKGSGKLHD